MTRLFCLALMLFGLGACDASDTPTLTTSVREGNCGEIVLQGNPPRVIDTASVQNSILCFLRAYQACAATALTIQEPNNVTRQFSVARNNSACVLRQAFQADANAPPAVADCKTARIENDALVIEACSHLGDFTLTP
jgi:hypothetical protein